jgi:D-sedoheptulose 7-phosphate isomerase
MLTDHDVVAAHSSAASTLDTYAAAIAEALEERQALLGTALRRMTTGTGELAAAAACLISTLRASGKVLVAGNGGSAAEAQHFAAELVGRFKRERAPYAALALTTDTSILTAIANDYGYRDVFARQVLGLGRPADVLVAFSTSGESENLLRAVETARELGMTTIAVTGSRRSSLERSADIALRIPLADTALVQELHMAVTHILCDIVETELACAERLVH